MRRALSKFCISVVGVAIVTSIAGCGGNDAPDASSASGVAADPNVAFAQYKEAAKPFECSKAYLEMYDAYDAKHYGIMKDRARQHRDIVATWDDHLSKIAFPVAAQPIVGRMRDHIAPELTGLNELVGIDDKDAGRILSVIMQVQVDDSSAVVEGDRLRAALGHPEPQAIIAADQLDLADLTFYKDKVPVSAKWKAAIAAKDLVGAKAANAIEEETLQRYIDTLGTIAWPPGFEDRVNALRGMLSGFIEFDRRQVDVATVAEIVPAPEEGASTMQSLADAETALWTDLVSLGDKSRPSKC
jgi:hypothetical protein